MPSPRNAAASLFRLYREEKLAVRREVGASVRLGQGPMLVPMAPNDRWLLDFVSDQLSGGPPLPHPDRLR
jgi:putative transposase